jgi:hypothetical protein
VRVIVPAALWAVLSASGVWPSAAQTNADVLRARTRDRLFALIRTYAPTQHFKIYRHDDDPFTIEAIYDKDLTYAPRFETWISVTRNATIQFRVYTQWYEGYLNIDKAQNSDAFMQRLLQLSDKDFFFWAADEDKDVFAGFTFTLESGFPEEAIKVVIRSIPLLDSDIGELEPIAGR